MNNNDITNHEAPTPENKKESLAWERLLKGRTITLFKPVDSLVAQDVIQDLYILESENSKAPIKLILNSPGGEVNSGFAIYDTMRFIKSDVYVICSGLCASIATVILLGANKEHRITLPNSRFLIHQPLIRGNIYGQASDIQIQATEITKTREKINKLLAQETGQSLEKIAIDTDRDYWMNAEEAKKYGLVTKIVSNQSELGI